MSRIITETERLLPIFGGYISIKKDGNEFYIAGVPSIVPGADRYRDSLSKNDEAFKCYLDYGKISVRSLYP